MNREESNFLQERVSDLCRLLSRSLKRDDDIAKQSACFALLLREAAVLVHGERQDVGMSVHTPEILVQLLYMGVVTEGNADLGGIGEATVFKSGKNGVPYHCLKIKMCAIKVIGFSESNKKLSCHYSCVSFFLNLCDC